MKIICWSHLRLHPPLYLFISKSRIFATFRPSINISGIWDPLTLRHLETPVTSHQFENWKTWTNGNNGADAFLDWCDLYWEVTCSPLNTVLLCGCIPWHTSMVSTECLCRLITDIVRHCVHEHGTPSVHTMTLTFDRWPMNQNLISSSN